MLPMTRSSRIRTCLVDCERVGQSQVGTLKIVRMLVLKYEIVEYLIQCTICSLEYNLP